MQLTPDDVRGLAVHLAARIMAAAEPGRGMTRGAYRSVNARLDQGWGDMERRVHGMPGIATVNTQTGSNRHMRLVQSEVSTGSGVR